MRGLSYEDEMEEALAFEAQWAGRSYASLVVDSFIREGINQNPELCVCHGSGWISSPYDSWHICGVHYHGQPNPEHESDEFWDTPEGISLLATQPR